MNFIKEDFFIVLVIVSSLIPSLLIANKLTAKIAKTSLIPPLNGPHTSKAPPISAPVPAPVRLHHLAHS